MPKSYEMRLSGSVCMCVYMCVCVWVLCMCMKLYYYESYVFSSASEELGNKSNYVSC